MDKEKFVQLIADYREGKISAEEFSKLRDGGTSGTNAHPPTHQTASYQTGEPLDGSGHSPWAAIAVVAVGMGLAFIFLSLAGSFEGVFWLNFTIGILICGALTALVADRKGKDPLTWFIYGAALFIFAFPAILIMSPNEKVLDRRAVEHGDKRACPFCAELIKKEARVCRFCNRELPPLSPLQQEESPTKEETYSVVDNSSVQSSYRSTRANNGTPICTKPIIWLGGGLLLILCVTAFVFFWYIPRQKADEQRAQVQATEIVGDINNTLLGVVLLMIGDTGFGTSLTSLPTMGDVLLKLQEADRIQKKQGKEDELDTSIRHPERFTLFADTARQNRLNIKYDLSRVSKRTKEKILLGNIGKYKMQNEDGTPFQGHGNAVYIQTPIRVE